MTLSEFLQQLQQDPQSITFADTMAVIDAHYDYTPASFSNGNVVNQAGQNSGSCKLFAFALLNKLTEEQTLACFGDYYRQDVLQHPDGSDHQNIRNFMKTGWAGIRFEQMPLQAR